LRYFFASCFQISTQTAGFFVEILNFIEKKFLFNQTNPKMNFAEKFKIHFQNKHNCLLAELFSSTIFFLYFLTIQLNTGI